MFRDQEILAFYLPQFHPIPENDEWWGKGFTEWRSVARARRLFPGHYQPHVPGDLGFYDLRVDAVREEQAELAAEAGITGFVYWHYWFHGRELLEMPLRRLVSQPKVKSKFCVAWANHNWTRRWVGGDSDVVLAQTYSAADDRAHIRSLRPMLMDERYVRSEGRPIIFVYRASDLPNPRATASVWRSEAAKWGLPGLYLIRLESSPRDIGNPLDWGFDASAQHEPTWWGTMRSPIHHLAARAARRAFGSFYPVVASYEAFAQGALQRSYESLTLGFDRWPSVAVGFDNTPRYGHRKQGIALVGGSPAAYEAWLREACRLSLKSAQDRGGASLVMINAWNEWAEGMHLEPDLKYGHAYLHATRRAVEAARSLAVGV